MLVRELAYCINTEASLKRRKSVSTAYLNRFTHSVVSSEDVTWLLAATKPLLLVVC
jgi:hypothetical protein